MMLSYVLAVGPLEAYFTVVYFHTAVVGAFLHTIRMEHHTLMCSLMPA